MSEHPYIPLYVDDYEAATTHLSLEEDGAYNRLLRLCWRTPGCSLPDDAGWIARKLRISTEVFDRVAKPVLAEFFSLHKGRLIQRRLKAEYDDIAQKKLARKKAGQAGGRAKARKTKAKPASNATFLLGDTRAFQTQTQNHIQKETPNPQPGDWDLFEDDQQSVVQPEPEKPPEIEEPPKPEKRKRQPKPDADPADIQTAFDEWNVLAKRLNLPMAKDLTPERRKRLKARLAKSGLEGWREALAGVEASEFCRGLKTDFRAGLDFLLQPSSFQKLIEGGYGREAPVANTTAGSGRRYRFPNEEIRAAAVRALGEDWVSRRLDYCQFQEVPTRMILADNTFIRDEILSEGDVFKRLGIQGAKLSPRAVA
jgi:uncharacterized protein YdaU (DUF1376 family)